MFDYSQHSTNAMNVIGGNNSNRVTDQQQSIHNNPYFQINNSRASATAPAPTRHSNDNGGRGHRKN